MWLGLVLVHAVDLDGLGGIGIHGYPASCLFLLYIYVSGYVGVGISGYRVGVIAGYLDFVVVESLGTWLQCFLVPWSLGDLDLGLDW